MCECCVRVRGVSECCACVSDVCECCACVSDVCECCAFLRRVTTSKKKYFLNNFLIFQFYSLLGLQNIIVSLI